MLQAVFLCNGLNWSRRVRVQLQVLSAALSLLGQEWGAMIQGGLKVGLIGVPLCSAALKDRSPADPVILQS